MPPQEAAIFLFFIKGCNPVIGRGLHIAFNIFFRDITILKKMLTDRIIREERQIKRLEDKTFGEFEKIENKNDIYDLVHATELLRLEIPNKDIEAMLDKYTAKYKEIRGGQPEQRGL